MTDFTISFLTIKDEVLENFIGQRHSYDICTAYDYSRPIKGMTAILLIIDRISNKECTEIYKMKYFFKYEPTETTRLLSTDHLRFITQAI